MCEHHHLLPFLKCDADAEETKKDKQQILKKFLALASVYLRCEWTEALRSVHT